MENKPNIRFKQHTDDWEQRKLGDVLQFQNGFNGGREVYGEGTAFISVMDILNNQFITYDCIRGKANVSDEELRRFSVQYGDVLFQRSSENVEDAGTSNVYVDKENTAIFGGFVIRGRQIAPYSPKFMKYLLDTKVVRYQITRKAQGAQHVNVSQETLQDIEIILPSIEEQIAIENSLCNLDNLITLHQRKCDETKELKKYMLQKMFPKKGEKNPDIRFSGFTDDWEQRKLGELMDVTSVKRIHQSDWTDSGIRFLRARDIVAESKNEEVEEPLFISEEKYEEYSALSGKVKQGDLLVTGVGTIGVPMLINSDDPLYFKDGNIIWFKNENAIDGRFFYHSFNGESIQKFIKESAGIGTVGTYTIDSGKKTPINLPIKKEEQVKIGEYFDNLDNLITLHQRKCDELKEVKRYMLQNMFPQKG